MIGDRWGVTNDEVIRHYPCDDVVLAPVVQAWRGVTVHATPDDIWPWVTQIRLAPYSYDLVDNFGRRSPQELRDLADPAPGQYFTVAGGRPSGRILTVEPRTQLTGQIMGARCPTCSRHPTRRRACCSKSSPHATPGWPHFYPSATSSWLAGNCSTSNGLQNNRSEGRAPDARTGEGTTTGGRKTRSVVRCTMRSVTAKRDRSSRRRP